MYMYMEINKSLHVHIHNCTIGCEGFVKLSLRLKLHVHVLMYVECYQCLYYVGL